MLIGCVESWLRLISHKYSTCKNVTHRTYVVLNPRICKKFRGVTQKSEKSVNIYRYHFLANRDTRSLECPYRVP